jgi:hypothetical protein
MDETPLNLEEYKDLLLDCIVTKDDTFGLRVLKENNYHLEPGYLDFKKIISRFVINFGTPNLIKECYRQKILTLKLKIEKNITATHFAFSHGNKPMIEFLMSQGVSLHKENKDYYYLRLLANNTSNGAECYEFLSKSDYLNEPEEEQKYKFLDIVIMNKNIRLLLKVLEDGKFGTNFTYEQVSKQLFFHNNSPYTINSLELLKIQSEKETLERQIKDKGSNIKLKL